MLIFSFPKKILAYIQKIAPKNESAKTTLSSFLTAFLTPFLIIVPRACLKIIIL